MKVLFIGGGNMATAMIGGMIAKGVAVNDIEAVDINSASREKLSHEFGIQTYSDCLMSAKNADVLILAVKPQQLREVAKTLGPSLVNQLILTIAAGIRTGSLSTWLNGYRNIVRAMPNTPALVRAGITGLYATENVKEQDRKAAEILLNAVGETIWFEREEELDAVTALSGSGPAYVFYFLEAMQEAGRQMGLSLQASRLLSLQTFTGAAKLAFESSDLPETLRQKVTSKGGTTERALLHMEHADIKKQFVAGILAAQKRSREMGDELGAII